MTNAIKVLLQMTSVSLQPVPSLPFKTYKVVMIHNIRGLCNSLPVSE
jgi:hypothetical protein